MVNEVQYIKKTVIKSSKWYMLRMKMYKSDREKIIFCWEMSKDFVKVVQSLSYIWLCDPMDCNTPDFPVLHHLPELDQTNVHWVGDAVQPCVILFSSCLQSFPASGSSNDLALQIRWPKHWSFSFGISPFNEYSGLISFRIDWFDLLTVLGTLKSLL